MDSSRPQYRPHQPLAAEDSSGKLQELVINSWLIERKQEENYFK